MVSDTNAGRSVHKEAQIVAQRLESLGRLAGGVAHDFNDLFGVILGYVELARVSLGPESDAARRHLALALSTVDRARALTERVLNVSRGTGDEDGPADPNVVVSEICELVGHTIDRRVTLRLTLGNATPWVGLSRDQLGQVVLALCVNAADAMPSGGTLAVDVRRQRIEHDGAPVKPGAYARIDVRDTRGRLAAETTDRMFESTANDAQGGRLGLVRDLARRVGGELTFVSDDDGAVFNVWVPAVEADPRSQEALLPLLGTGIGLGGRLLVVDDEPGVREVTRMHLEAAGYDVQVAATADQALAALRAEPGAFRAVLLDLNLPDRSGTDVAWVIGELERPPALVIVTGDVGRAAELGIAPETPRVSKPILRRGLLDAVARAILTTE